MVEHPYTDECMVYPSEWAFLDGWKGEAAQWVAPRIQFMRDMFAKRGYNSYWMLAAHHRMMRVDPFISMGLRPAGSKASILIAFGFSYERMRQWPDGFVNHYVDMCCTQYEAFAGSQVLPINCEAVLDRYCADYGVQRIAWTLPKDREEQAFAAPTLDLSDTAGFNPDIHQTDEWGEPLTDEYGEFIDIPAKEDDPLS